VQATAPVVRVRNAPVGLVDYQAAGARLAPAACGEDLVLGPLPPGARLVVSEAGLDWLLAVRGLGFMAAAALLILWATRASARPGRYQGWGRDAREGR